MEIELTFESLAFFSFSSSSSFSYCLKLLDKNPNTRLGSPNSPLGEINENVFFHEIDWRKLERRQLESPFKPEIVSETFCIMCLYIFGKNKAKRAFFALLLFISHLLFLSFVCHTQCSFFYFTFPHCICECQLT